MHAIFRGRVQGVFFRATARDYAIPLHIRGTAKNLYDGTVEIRAQGTQHHLNLFVQQLQEEYHLDPQTSASLTFSAPKELFDDFRIVY